MKLNITDRGILQIDDVRIVNRNFSGVEIKRGKDVYNRSGDRNFSLFFTDADAAEYLHNEGWKIDVTVSEDVELAEYYQNAGYKTRIKTASQQKAQELSNLGWKVYYNSQTQPEDVEEFYMPVKVAFNDRGPHIFLVTNGKAIKLDEDTVSRLDRISMPRVSLDIRPYDWEVNGKTGRSAYLVSMEVEIDTDRISAKWDIQDDDEAPFEE